MTSTKERKAILKWLKEHNTSPTTNMPLSKEDLRPNLTIKNHIDDFQARGFLPEADDDEDDDEDDQLIAKQRSGEKMMNIQDDNRKTDKIVVAPKQFIGFFKTPKIKVGKHLNGSGTKVWVNLSDAIEFARQCGNVPGKNLFHIQNTHGKAYFYGSGEDSGLTGEETWSFHDGKSGIVGPGNVMEMQEGNLKTVQKKSIIKDKLLPGFIQQQKANQEKTDKGWFNNIFMRR